MKIFELDDKIYGVSLENCKFCLFFAVDPAVRDHVSVQASSLCPGTGRKAFPGCLGISSACGSGRRREITLSASGTAAGIRAGLWDHRSPKRRYVKSFD